MNHSPLLRFQGLVALFCLGMAGCRSASFAPPVLQLQETVQTPALATEFSIADHSQHSIAIPATPAARPTSSPPLRLCSGEIAFTDEAVDSVDTLSGQPVENEPCADRQLGIDEVCDQPFTFRSDLSQAGSMLWDDTKALFEWRNAAILGVGLGAALAMRPSLDGDVRAATLNHADLWGGGSEFLSDLGEPYVQWPAWLGLYAYSVHTDNEELHNVSRSLFSSLVLTSVADVVIKYIANTDRPSQEFSNGQYGFPSYHTASSFAIAGVIDEYYGMRAGLPAYAVAGLIGWSRIDLRAHDLSDVVFGAVLGAVIGKSVAHFHRTGDGRVHLSPWYEPSNKCTGLMMEMTFD